MARSIKTLKDVVDWGLCTGCGACHYACTKGAVRLVNVEAIGIRPEFKSDCGSCTSCLSICPGYAIDGDLETRTHSKQTEADHEFGPALEVWEGYASDPEIRRRASSGGILTALSLYCLEQESMEFVLHTAMEEARPWANRTVESRTREELLSRTGSRYAPASPCDGLASIEKSPRKCVFVGKPCDCAAVAKLRREHPALDRNLGLVLSFFCAGTPSTEGTVRLIEDLGITKQDANSLRYRGDGWPGRFKVSYADRTREASCSYNESWGKLQKYRPLRCHLCPDGLGRVADISCGDAWNQYDENSDSGLSIVVVRTRRGQDLLRRAVTARYVHLTPVGPTAVFAAQSHLLARRRELFGRLLAMRFMLIPIPIFMGFSLVHSWRSLPFPEKLRIVLGTIKRLVLRNLWRPHPI